jgi:hypothetical protein
MMLTVITNVGQTKHRDLPPRVATLNQRPRNDAAGLLDP